MAQCCAFVGTRRSGFCPHNLLLHHKVQEEGRPFTNRALQRGQEPASAAQPSLAVRQMGRKTPFLPPYMLFVCLFWVVFFRGGAHLPVSPNQDYCCLPRHHTNRQSHPWLEPPQELIRACSRIWNMESRKQRLRVSCWPPIL